MGIQSSSVEKPQAPKLALPFNGTDGGSICGDYILRATPRSLPQALLWHIHGPLPKGSLTLISADKMRTSGAIVQFGLLAQNPRFPGLPRSHRYVCGMCVLGCVCVCIADNRLIPYPWRGVLSRGTSPHLVTYSCSARAASSVMV